jgi:hypothetical protein
MVAMLIDRDLRRGELLARHVESIQQREEHWVIAGQAAHLPLMIVPGRMRQETLSGFPPLLRR